MNLNKNRIMDGGRWRPPVRTIRVEVIGKDGKPRMEERLERLCSTRNIRALGPAGQVVFLVLGNANAMAEEGKTPYYDQKLTAKKAKGWLPWGRCPVAMVAAQEIDQRMLKNPELREASPCMGGGFSADNPCPHAIAERDYRTAVHNERDRGKADAYKAEAERDRDQRDRHHEELIKGQQDQAKALQGALEAIAGKRGKRDDG